MCLSCKIKETNNRSSNYRSRNPQKMSYVDLSLCKSVYILWGGVSGPFMTIPDRVSPCTLGEANENWVQIQQHQGRPGAKAGRSERGWRGGNVGLTNPGHPTPGPPHYLRQYKQEILFIYSGFRFVQLCFGVVMSLLQEFNWDSNKVCITFTTKKVLCII